MPQLRSISLLQFKNYPSRRFDFDERITGIAGKNGIGKTNLLDAIHFCCFTKGYFGSNDALGIAFGENGFRLESRFEGSAGEQLIVLVHRGNRKELSVNGAPIAKLSEHIGSIPAVIIAPDDIELVNGSSDVRRKYLDTILCQADRAYLLSLMRHNKLLQERNALLKKMAEWPGRSADLLEAIDKQLVPLTSTVFAARRDMMQRISPLARAFYFELSGNSEEVDVAYRSQLFDTPPEELLKSHLRKDIVLQRTTAGVHRDDLQLLFQSQPFKNIASQGQKKSMLFALKMAEFSILQQIKGFAPILLLDDVFEKLDSDRISQLLAWVAGLDAQVFITDTQKDRLAAALSALNAAHTIIEL